MNLATENSDGFLIIKVREARLDSSNSAALKNYIFSQIEQGADRFILDLSMVDFMDSSGLAGILPTVNKLPSGGAILMAGLSERVDQLFKLTKLDTIFDIYPSVAEALAGSKS